MSFITQKLDGHVLYITIDRVEVHNALSPQVYHELSLVLDEVDANGDIWLAVLTGAGDRAFSAGRDLKQMAYIASASEDEKATEKELWANTVRLTDRFAFSKPIIAKLNGFAFGGGLELALACDIIVAAEHVTMGLPEPRRGLIAMAGGVHRLPRQIGLKAAMGYLLTGRSMTAQRGYELGLVNQVVPKEALDDAVYSWVSDMLTCAPISLRSTKQCAMQGLNYPLEDAMTRTYPMEEQRKSSLDTLEGPKAFSEKRAPIWSGR